MDRQPEKTNWRRIGLVATTLLVPGGMVIGGLIAARRWRARANAADPGGETATPAPVENASPPTE